MKRAIFGLLATSGLVLGNPLETALVGSSPSSSGSFISNFFVGGSIGYLHESEEEMYHLQLGVDLQPQLAGMDQSLFLEVGYNELEFFGVEQEIVPVTLNYQLERELFGNVSIYAGAGGGIAFYEVTGGGGFKADDEVFWGQIFGGLIVDLCQNFEVFAGLRGLYLDEVNINGFTTDSGDDLLWEFGARFKF